jgi:hypothetical protein
LILKLLIVIYFVLNLFFSISFLRIWFNLIFISILVLIFMIVICFSLNIFIIEFFLSIRFGPYSFDCYLFYLKWFMKLDFNKLEKNINNLFSNLFSIT